MEFNFFISKSTNLDENGIGIIHGKNLKPNYHSYLQTNNDKLLSATDQLTHVIDKMGEASAKAQGLPTTITTYGRLAGSDQRLYIKADEKLCLGILKVGVKNLFYRDYAGAVKEIKPLCVLDFYVHESVQRLGIGKEIFEKMLEEENILPEKIAYDRPSPKLIGFLRKHYNLVKFIPQNNNFVIFEQYFTSNSQRSKEYKQRPASSNYEKSIVSTNSNKNSSNERNQSNKFQTFERTQYTKKNEKDNTPLEDEFKNLTLEEKKSSKSKNEFQKESQQTHLNKIEAKPQEQPYSAKSGNYFNKKEQDKKSSFSEATRPQHAMREDPNHLKREQMARKKEVESKNDDPYLTKLEQQIQSTESEINNIKEKLQGYHHNEYQPKYTQYPNNYRSNTATAQLRTPWGSTDVYGKGYSTSASQYGSYYNKK